MKKAIIKILTICIPISKWRKIARDWLNYILNVLPYRCCGVKFGRDFVLNGTMHLTKHCSFGDDVHVNVLHVEGVGALSVGNHVRIGREVLIITSSHDYTDGILPYGKNHIVKSVIVDDYVWIGSRVTLLPGTKIGARAIVQAGAVVHGEVAPDAIVGGNPAKVFMWRDKVQK